MRLIGDPVEQGYFLRLAWHYPGYRRQAAEFFVTDAVFTIYRLFLSMQFFDFVSIRFSLFPIAPCLFAILHFDVTLGFHESLILHPLDFRTIELFLPGRSPVPIKAAHSLFVYLKTVLVIF